VTSSKILVIEDLEDIRDLLEVFFKKRGFEVIQADRGVPGVALARREKPQVVLVDMRLPDIDGLEVLRRLKKFDGTTKIFLLSGFYAEDAEREALSEGATACLKKSSGMENVVNVISAAMRETKGEAP
jgi:two-component system, response regulator, stage 0 sporulation protein F